MGSITRQNYVLLKSSSRPSPKSASTLKWRPELEKSFPRRRQVRLHKSKSIEETRPHRRYDDRGASTYRGKRCGKLSKGQMEVYVCQFLYVRVHADHDDGVCYSRQQCPTPHQDERLRKGYAWAVSGTLACWTLVLRD